MLLGRALRETATRIVPRVNKGLPTLQHRFTHSSAREGIKSSKKSWFIAGSITCGVVYIWSSSKTVLAENKPVVTGDETTPSVVPNAPKQRPPIIKVLTENERIEAEERVAAEEAAKEVLAEHSAHEKNMPPPLSQHHSYPIEEAQLTFLPAVPPPIERTHPVRLLVKMNTHVKELPIDASNTYDCWTFNGSVPGPFIRARKGDIMEVHFRNEDTSGMLHNLDFHAVTGPGGGAPLLTPERGAVKRACFKLTQPGLFMYHCAVDPVAVHISNGMYGMMLVEPEEGLPHVDREYGVLQSEFYAAPDPANSDPHKLSINYEDVMSSNPSHIVFNGRDGALIEKPLVANTDERIRIFFGNAGPNLVSSFHVIGTVFDKVYRDADVISPPGRGIQCTAVPAGGATIVEFKASVPGTYTLLDHSISRLEKGCVGYLNVVGDERPDIYHSDEPPKSCPNCKLHP